MKKKLLCLMLSALLAVSFLSACSQGSGTGEEDSKTASTAGTNAGTGTEADTEPATMRFMWWGGDTRHEATLKAIDRYKELHPNITIEAEYQGYDGYQQKIMTQIAGGNEPDIMQLDYIWFSDLSNQEGDKFVDLSTAPAVDLSSYSKEFLDQFCSINGKVISLPMGTNGYGIVINKKFFQKHNIPLDVKFTWESIIEEAARVHKEDPKDYLFTTESNSLSGFIFEQYLLSKTGFHWMADDSSAVRATKEQLVDAFAYIQKLFSSPGIQPLGESSLFTGQMEQNPIWANNQLGFILSWSGGLGTLGSVIGDDNLAVSDPPFAAGGKILIPAKPSMVAAVSKRSSYIDAAAAFINWMMSDMEAVEILGTERSVPTNEKARAHLEETGAVSPLMAQMVKVSLENPAPRTPDLAFNSEIGELVSTILEEVAFGNIAPDKAADKFITNVNDKLASLK